MIRSVVTLLCVSTVLVGCGKETPPPATPPAPVVAPNTPPIAAPSAPAAAAPAPAPTAPPPAQVTAPGGAVAPTEDTLDTFRQDAKGAKTISDMQILQGAVDGYNTTRVNLLEPDSKPGPELKDLSDLVKYRRLPKLPAAPAGKKYSLDQKTQKVILVNE